MAKNTQKIYDQHGAAFRDVSAWVVVKDGERVATISTKTTGHNNPNGVTVTAFVHVFGGQMVKGSTGPGGGYDMQSAAILDACRKIDPASYIYSPTELAEHKLARQPLEFIACQGHAERIRGVMDCSQDIPWQLRDMGYQVFQAV